MSKWLSPHQDFHALSAYLAGQRGSSFLYFMADFHLLFFLYTCDVAGFQMKVCLPAPLPTCLHQLISCLHSLIFLTCAEQSLQEIRQRQTPGAAATTGPH